MEFKSAISHMGIMSGGVSERALGTFVHTTKITRVWHLFVQCGSRTERAELVNMARMGCFRRTVGDGDNTYRPPYLHAANAMSLLLSKL